MRSKPCREAEAARIALLRSQRFARGVCLRCGAPRDPSSVELCAAHLVTQRLQARRRYGVTHPWKGRLSDGV